MSSRSDLEAPFHVRSSEHPFFNYTSGRFLCNEHARLKERHLIFNVLELCRVVATAVGKTVDDVTRLEKLTEGGFYRIFEATLSDGKEVIARLPFTCTLPKANGILSEVATMAFLRMRGLPIPKVYDWSATTENTVGSEYMIMEKVQGTDLQQDWHSMTVERRLHVVQQIVRLERILFGISLPASGAIYFKDTLPAETPSVDISDSRDDDDLIQFCVGPSTEYLWWYCKRAQLGADMGPWMDTASVLEAVGRRELLWLEKYGKPRFPHNWAYSDLYNFEKLKPDTQIKALQDYLKIVHYIVPEDQEMNTPTLRHPDLSPNNIFISDAGEITGIIDWQHCTALPLFLQARIPKHFANHGDEESDNFRPPKLPNNFDSMSDEDKEIEEDAYRRRQLHFFYLGATIHENPRHCNALRFDPEAHRAKLFAKAGYPWEGDNASLRAQLMRTVANWSKLVSDHSSDCPISYPEHEVEECLAIDAQQKRADSNMEALRDYLGVNMDGWVPNHHFEESKETAASLKAGLMAKAETELEKENVEENWPFQDHDVIE